MVVGNRPQFIKSAPLSVALRDAGIDEVVLHSGQHWDPEMSQVFFDELGLPEPRYRLDLRTADTEGDDAADPRGDRRGAARLGARLGDTNSTPPGRARPWARLPSHMSRRASAASTCRCPRSGTGSRSTGSSAVLFCPDERSARQLEVEGVGGRREVVGDVMADATRLFLPIAAPRAQGAVRVGRTSP